MPKKTLYQLYYSRPAKIWRATWIVMPPEAQLIYQSYVIFLDALAPMPEHATHELSVYSVDPAYPIPYDIDISCLPKEHLLFPANHGYRFNAASNINALGRIWRLVRIIERGELSLDSNATSQWDEIFVDGRSVKMTDHPLDT